VDLPAQKNVHDYWVVGYRGLEESPSPPGDRRNSLNVGAKLRRINICTTREGKNICREGYTSCGVLYLLWRIRAGRRGVAVGFVERRKLHGNTPSLRW